MRSCAWSRRHRRSARAAWPKEIASGGSAIETILRRAAQSLGVLTQELGARPRAAPRPDHPAQKLELVRLTSEKLILVLTLKGGTVRTIFIEMRGEIADEAITLVRARAQRAAGRDTRIADIRLSTEPRVAPPRRASPGGDASELLNIFVQEGEQIFDVGGTGAG
jgi:heat-inducible transcriptional repressor